MTSSLVMSVWRGADIDVAPFRARYLEALGTAVAGARGLIGCEACILDRDVRASLGTVGNGAPTHDLWVTLRFEDGHARSAFEDDGRLAALNAPELAAWTTRAVTRHTDGLDASARGTDERPLEHRKLAAAASGSTPGGTPGDGSADYAVFGTVYRHPTLSHAEFLDHYRRVHWHYVPDLPAVQRYDIHLTESDHAGGGKLAMSPPLPDSYILMTFPSETACFEALGTPLGEAAIADWKGFLWWVDFEAVELVPVSASA